MALTLSHTYVAPQSEASTSGPPSGRVGPNEWNANHSLSGGTNTCILFDNAGTIGEDTNLTWTIGSGQINLLTTAVGSFAAFGTQTYAPTDPTFASVQNRKVIFSENAFISGDFSTTPWDGFATGINIYNGYKYTGAVLASIMDTQIGPTINSDSTGHIHEFYTLFLDPSRYSTAACDNFRTLNIDAVNYTGNLSTFFSVFDTSIQFGSGNVTEMYGFFENFDHNGTGTVSQMYAFLSNPRVDNGGTVTNFVDFYAGGLQTALVGTITNYIGVKISDHSGIGGTLSLNLQSLGANSVNQFDGTISLGVGGSHTGVQKFVGTTSGTVTVQSQDAAGTWTFKWPTSAGTNLYVLQTDGSGNTSWVPQSGGGSPSLPLNSVQYDNAGSFGGAAHFNIVSGQPNVDNTFAYLYNSLNAIFSVPSGGGGSGESWFLGGAGALPTTITTGFANFCEGPGAGQALTTGHWNMVEGSQALASCTTGYSNVAIGRFAMNAVIDSHDNVALGTGAFQLATTGNHDNMAIGTNAMGSGVLVNAIENVAVGTGAGQNLSGSAAFNTLIGTSAGGNLGGAIDQTFIGDSAGLDATTGAGANTFIGYNTGRGITTGFFNTVIGAQVTGLAANLTYNLIIANSTGTIYLQSDQNTNKTKLLNASAGVYTSSASVMLGSTVSITSGAGTGSGVTFTNAPGSSVSTGNPTKWLPYDDNGTTRYIPAF